MTKISSSQFKTEFQGGIANDAATQARLNQAGVDGKKLLTESDANKDGRIAGAELDTLWKKIDDFDRDGSRQTVTQAAGLVQALRAPPPPPVTTTTATTTTGPAAPDLYAADAGTLKKGDKGPDVKAAQEKLVRAGYELPRYGADGGYGDETVVAVRQFQTDNRLPVTGQLDPATLAKLETAPPSTKAVQFPEYDKMFKDGVLQTTLGLGFDEDGNDIQLRRDMLSGLQERGFARLDVKNLTDDQLRNKGFDPKTIDRDATYFTKTFQHDGKDVQSLVKLVDRNTPDAKGRFAAGMRDDDLVIYSGHGRRGSGPDFDHADSAAGNYVIGKPVEEGHYQLGGNDVGKAGALGNQYQLMFFDACNTKYYVDDLRSRPRNKDAGNLDIVASTRELPWSTSKSDMFAMLDGVMGGRSIQDIKGRLDQDNAEAGKGAAFLADGFRGNSYRPAAP
jgi:peptidoglycan hydrolase-like protein with peptidoglycan-binding domain